MKGNLYLLKQKQMSLLLACSIIHTTPTRGLLFPTSLVVGHVLLEISKYCYHFIRHGEEIEGKVADIWPSRSPIVLLFVKKLYFLPKKYQNFQKKDLLKYIRP